jgi:hypothetical protein
MQARHQLPSFSANCYCVLDRYEPRHSYATLQCYRGLTEGTEGIESAKAEAPAELPTRRVNGRMWQPGESGNPSAGPLALAAVILRDRCNTAGVDLR